MENEKEQEVYINSELLAYQIAGILNQKGERIIDDVYRATISLLEDKYGILFDVDPKVEI